MTITLDKALDILRANEARLRARGVVHAAVFGSVARGEGRSNSDIDVLVDLDPAERVGLFDFVRIKLDLSELMGAAVDLVERRALAGSVEDQALLEKVDAF
jgi:hypothetical protein